MFKSLDKLLLERFSLGLKKYSLINQIDRKSFVNSIKILGRICYIITQEIRVNKNICRKLKGFVDLRDIVEPVYVNLFEINHVLKQEIKILNRINFLVVFYFKMKSLFSKQNNFERMVDDFNVCYNEEIKLNELFLEKDILNLLPKEYRVDKKRLKDSLELVLSLQNEIHKIGKSVGDVKLVKKHAGDALKLVDLVQKTELYGFIKQDVEFIKDKLVFIVKHPKENKLAYVLGTVYIVSPLTFEATGVVLFFRYLAKYSVNKVKNIRNKV